MRLTNSKIESLLTQTAECAGFWRRFLNSTPQGDDFLADFQPIDLAALDLHIRRWDGKDYYIWNPWQTLTPDDVRRFGESRFAVSLVGLVSFHPNGFVRQAATKELALHREGRELPFLLIRLNDWVPQVREIAAAAVHERITPAYASHLLANFPLLLRLEKASRVDRKLIQTVREILCAPPSREVLRNALTAGDKNVRRVAYKLLGQGEPSEKVALLKVVQAEADATLRARVVCVLLPKLSPDEVLAISEPLLNDRYMPVRRAVLWEVATKLPDASADPIRRALLDAHIALREVAQRFAVQAGVTNLRGFYTDAVRDESPRVRFAAICGLAECGEASDAFAVLQFLDAPNSIIRRAAVYAIGKLDPATFLSNLVGMLRDDYATVSHAAFKALRPHAQEIPLRSLEQVLDNAQQYMRRNALKLILCRRKWERLPALIVAAVDDDTKIATMAASGLSTWIAKFNISYDDPPAGDVAKISTALDYASPRLPPDVLKQLKACLIAYPV